MSLTKLFEEYPGRINKEIVLKRINEQNKLWDKGNGALLKEALKKYTTFKAQEIQVSNDGIVSFLGKNNPDVEAAIKSFGQWRKGPFKILDIDIDTEWKSNLKWDRLKDSLPELEDKNILDIGCNNGYYMYRMLEHNPKLVLGIDPTIKYKAQFDFLKSLKPDVPLSMELLGIEDLALFKTTFDVIFSMGILYHHRSPLQQLFDMRMALVHGGSLVLETIILPGDQEEIITPKDRYAGMNNVWLLPTQKALMTWLERSKFANIEVINLGWEHSNEQRATEWSTMTSYSDFIDGDNTVEGYPAPERIIIKAIKK